MRRTLIVLAIDLMVAIASAHGDNWAGKCVEVKDGYTIVVMHGEKAERSTGSTPTKAPIQRLTQDEVIRIAEEIAKAEGYDIAKYNITGCHYEYTRKDRSWTVFFTLKPPTPPGGHFAVSIDDQTKKAKLMRGE